MINKITATTNEALRERWSTVSILTLILTLGKAYSIRGEFAVDVQSYIAQLFVALLLSFIVAMAIHIIIFIVFSPRQKPVAYSVIQTTTAPVKSKEQHEATITAMNKELIAAEKINMPAKPAEKTVKPVDLHKELGIPKRAAKKPSKKVTRKPAKKKAAAKKKK